MSLPRQASAIIVAIERYDLGAEWNLDGPAEDARQFVDWLIESGVLPSQIRLFVAANQDKLTKFSRDVKRMQPTAAAVNAAFDEIASDAGEGDDLLFVHWGGHGFFAKGGGRELWYCDSTPERPLAFDVYARIAQLGERRSGSKQIWLIDTCARPLDLYNDAHRLMLQARMPQTAPAERGYGVEQFVLFSATRGQWAYNKNGQGLFSRELLGRLRAHASANARKWPPPIQEIAEEVKKHFGQLSFEKGQEQAPTYMWIRPFGGENVFYGRAPRQYVPDREEGLSDLARKIDELAKEVRARGARVGERQEEHDRDATLRRLAGNEPFVGRQDCFRSLHAAGLKGGYYGLTGPPGAGKSRVLARWIQAARLGGELTFCQHFFERGTKGQRVSEGMVSLCRQLLRVHGLQAPVSEAEPWQLKHILAETLSLPHGSPLVVVIDGLDDAVVSEHLEALHGVPFEKGVFPERLGKNVAVIFSIRDSSGPDRGEWLGEALGGIKCRVLALPLLTSESIRDLLEQQYGPADTHTISAMAKSLSEKTDGLPIYLHYVIEELRTVDRSRWQEHIASMPEGFVDYVAMSMHVALQWRAALRFMAEAKGALSDSDLIALTGFDQALGQQLKREDTRDIPREIARWLTCTRSGRHITLMFQHVAVAEAYSHAFDQRERRQVLDVLLAYCEQNVRTAQGSSRYVLLHYAAHLADAIRSERQRDVPHSPLLEAPLPRLLSLATDNEFRARQVAEIPEQPALPLHTARTALLSAAEADHATGIAQLIIECASRSEQLLTGSPLKLYRARNRKDFASAIAAADRWTTPAYHVLWKLLLCWEMVDYGDAKAARKLMQTVKRELDRSPTPRLNRALQTAFALVLAQLFPFHRELAVGIASATSGVLALARQLAHAGRYVDALSVAANDMSGGESRDGADIEQDIKWRQQKYAWEIFAGESEPNDDLSRLQRLRRARTVSWVAAAESLVPEGRLASLQSVVKVATRAIDAVNVSHPALTELCFGRHVADDLIPLLLRLARVQHAALDPASASSITRAYRYALACKRVTDEWRRTLYPDQFVSYLRDLALVSAELGFATLAACFFKRIDLVTIRAETALALAEIAGRLGAIPACRAYLAAAATANRAIAEADNRARNWVMLGAACRQWGSPSGERACFNRAKQAAASIESSLERARVAILFRQYGCVQEAAAMLCDVLGDPGPRSSGLSDLLAQAGLLDEAADAIDQEYWSLEERFRRRRKLADWAVRYREPQRAAELLEQIEAESTGMQHRSELLRECAHTWLALGCVDKARSLISAITWNKVRVEALCDLEEYAHGCGSRAELALEAARALAVKMGRWEWFDRAEALTHIASRELHTLLPRAFAADRARDTLGLLTSGTDVADRPVRAIEVMARIARMEAREARMNDAKRALQQALGLARESGSCAEAAPIIATTFAELGKVGVARRLSPVGTSEEVDGAMIWTCVRSALDQSVHPKAKRAALARAQKTARSMFTSHDGSGWARASCLIAHVQFTLGMKAEAYQTIDYVLNRADWIDVDSDTVRAAAAGVLAENDQVVSARKVADRVKVPEEHLDMQARIALADYRQGNQQSFAELLGYLAHELPERPSKVVAAVDFIALKGGNEITEKLLAWIDKELDQRQGALLLVICCVEARRGRATEAERILQHITSKGYILSSRRLIDGYLCLARAFGRAKASDDVNRCLQEALSLAQLADETVDTREAFTDIATTAAGLGAVDLALGLVSLVKHAPAAIAQIAAAFASSRSSQGFKQLLVLGATATDSVYDMISSLAELYPEARASLTSILADQQISGNFMIVEPPV